MLIQVWQTLQRSLPRMRLNEFAKRRFTSLTSKTLLNMALRVTLVVLISAGVSYGHVISRLEAQTQQQLEKYIMARGQQESSIFQLAEDNLMLLRDRLLQQFQQPIDQDLQDLQSDFQQRYFAWDDGTMRNFPQQRSPQEFDTVHHATTMVGRNVPITSVLQQRLLIAEKLVSRYGAAWTNRFVDTYFLMSENAGAIYWSGVPISLEANGTLYHPGEEYFYVADPQHNPARTPQWTGVYLDPSINLWMVSAAVPVYEGDRFLGTVGHDVVLTDLLEHTLKDLFPGTYNLIFRADGRLIVHPDRIQEIQQADGQLNLEAIADPHLQRIFAQVTQAPEAHVLDNVEDHEYLAVTQLQGPDWYLVTVYPKSLLAKAAWETARFVLLSGAIALLVEVLLLFSVLQQQIAQPLHQLTAASDQLAKGDFAIRLDADRQDEFGQLAQAFESMASQIKASFAELEQVNNELEQRVEERTIALQTTLQELHQTQAQMIQSEKMSALGQMVAGIAHEINNPVSFIHGNLTHMAEYSEALLRLIQLYRQHLPNPPIALQQEIKAVDLEFIEQDLTKVLQSMQVGTERIREIVLSLRNFSRLDEAACKAVDVHEGIDSTLMILHHRLKATDHRPDIQINRDYAQLPKIECYAGQLNQVLMNLLANAIDALEESLKESEESAAQATPIITIRTAALAQTITITIADNGPGITEAVRSRIFDPFFTTKPIGKGTGLGLSISYQIITERHQGQLRCHSTPGAGTEFVIEIPVALAQS